MSESSGSKDPLYDAPYVDIDEWRDQPIRHHYIHGGFKETECRFSLYFPPAERYEGRFFHMVLPIPGTETAATNPPHATTLANPIPFAIESGAYLVESNQGRMVMYPGDDPTITGYRASAATARYSRVVAAKIYGPHRPYGYIFGGSGGAYKTFTCIENCPGVWDGAVPFVPPSPMSIPSMFTVQGHALRVLRNKLPSIVDSMEPGGSGDMYEVLNAEEREALTEVTRMGFPPKSWFSYESIALTYTGIFSIFLDNMIKWDPGYFKDFWTVPGYLGQNPPESLLRARVQHKTRISRVMTANEVSKLGLTISLSAKIADKDGKIPAAIELEKMPGENLQGNTITLTSGAVAGNVLYISGVVGDLIMIGFGEENSRGLVDMKAGDEVMIDNSTYLASQTYHRHQIPSPDYYVWSQFLVDGKPLYPQRPSLLGPCFVRYSNGYIQTGRFKGKMIMVASAMDEVAFPWQADWYRNRVQDALGSQIDSHFRLWFVDNAMHSEPKVKPGSRRPVATTRIVDYAGVVQQALRDLSAWVEKGLAPPASTIYEVVDGQVQLPQTAAERKGVQPVVTMKVRGGVRTEVQVGEAVDFTATIEVPEGAGSIVGAKWDFEGTGNYPVVESLDSNNSSLSRITLTTTYTFSKPGTYFPVLLATSQRQGDSRTRHCLVQNLSRVRVVVH